jgi:DNA-binding response OmpR family regulator
VRKVLFAEDDLMIADMASEILADAGYCVCGIARTVDAAVALVLRHDPDLAVIDQRLADGGLGTTIPSRLALAGHHRRLGILYATGNMSAVMTIGSVGEACLVKPYRADDLVHALRLVDEIVETGAATPPFPNGFKRTAFPSHGQPRGAHG